MPDFLNSPLLLRLYRAGVLLVIVVLLHQQSRWHEARRSTAISLRVARKFFSKAYRIELRDADRGLHLVLDSRGDTIGGLLTTSPQMDHIIGYSGPNNLLIALDSHGAIAGLELLHSGDTDEHVQQVRRDPRFLRSFLGWKPSEQPAPKVEGVSGATLTTYAIAESIQQRLAGAAPSLRFPDPVTIEEVRALFTNAARLVPDRARLRVLDSAGQLLGYGVRTSPQADNVSGYRGPSECLVALARDGRTITGLRVRKTYDTDSYVDQVRRSESFMKLFVGRSIEELVGFEYPSETVAGISGATQTARAVAEGLKRRVIAELKAQVQGPRWRPKARDWALAGVIAGALLMSFTSLRGRPWVRVAWQLILVGYVGLVNHDLLSLALFGGWATHGLALKAAPGLVLLAAAALLVPWATRRQLYCHQICPHGAAQQLLGRVGLRLREWRGRREQFKIQNSNFESEMVPVGTDRAVRNVPRRFGVFSRLSRMGTKLTRTLEFVPMLLLGLSLLALLSGWRLNLANLEPFDAWVWGAGGMAAIVIALVGLAASLFVSQAYCRFGCPTGALLNFIRSSGSADRWGQRDWAALVFLLAGLSTVAGIRSWPRTELPPEPLGFHGRTMGTTWSVKIHDEVAEPSVIEQAIADEFEWAESLTSHWRTNTDLSLFNRTETTNAMAVPWPVLTLSRWASEISRATDGAYDITVGSLVKLWGFGPAPRRSEPPTDDEIAKVFPAIGWKKLEVLDGMLRKQHPGMELDFSSIAVGWAIDQVAQQLERRGYRHFLVEAGGELRARGRWTIEIEQPTRTCTLTNESIGTSGSYRRNFRSGGREFSHLIDPRTGRPITHRTVSVSVRHADCAQADAWAAALNVLGVESGRPLAEQLKLAAQFVVEQNGGRLEIRQTAAWTERESTAVAKPPAQAAKKE